MARLSSSSSSNSGDLVAAGGEKWEGGTNLAGYYLGTSTILVGGGTLQDAKEERTVYEFRSLGEDGCAFAHGEKFKVFETGLLKYQMTTGIYKMTKAAGISFPDYPYLILANEGKHKVKDKKYYAWKIEVEIDTDKDMAADFGGVDCFDNDEVEEGHETTEKVKDNWEVNADDFA
jgi:hypothetical protein